jgi:hypothetical protein
MREKFPSRAETCSSFPVRGISVLSFPFARKPSAPAPSHQPQVGLAPWGWKCGSFWPFWAPAVLVLPAPVRLAAYTSALDGFRALACLLPWFANRPPALQIICRDRKRRLILMDRRTSPQDLQNRTALGHRKLAAATLSCYY